MNEALCHFVLNHFVLRNSRDVVFRQCHYATDGPHKYRQTYLCVWRVMGVKQKLCSC